MTNEIKESTPAQFATWNRNGHGVRADCPPDHRYGGRAIADYDEFDQAYLEPSATSPFNALYGRPTMLELVGSVHGKRILDIDCAAGF